jgi:DNA gyrase inhibitor GyrI
MVRWMVRPVAVAMLAAMALAGSPDRADAKPERPEYVEVSTEDNFEIRDYATMVVAQFTMRGTYRQSVTKGYINLEQYFLGKNSVPEPIAMTTPAMVRDDLADGWSIMFILPKGYRVESAPRPNDRRIRVIEIPAHRVAVIVFPGKLNERAMREQSENLKAWLAAKGIAHKGDFTLAAYDTTRWKPSKWRGNEVMVTLK